MTVEGIITTDECETCHYVFSRYRDYMPDREKRPNIWSGRERRYCPNCKTVQAVVIVRHPEEKKL
jgi:hypothetical protein